MISDLKKRFSPAWELWNSLLFHDHTEAGCNPSPRNLWR